VNRFPIVLVIVATLLMVPMAGAEEAAGQGRVYVVFVDATGSAYELQDANFILNDRDVTAAPRYQVTRKKKLRSVREIAVTTGSHEFTLDLVVQGKGKGAFSYLNDYTFEIQESLTFEIGGNQSVAVWAWLGRRSNSLGDGEPGPPVELYSEVLRFPAQDSAVARHVAESWLADILDVKNPRRHFVDTP